MKPAKLTALGYFVGIQPSWPSRGTVQAWHVTAFDRRGNWKSGSIHATEAEARKARSGLFKHHRKLAKERAARRRSA